MSDPKKNVRGEAEERGGWGIGLVDEDTRSYLLKER